MIIAETILDKAFLFPAEHIAEFVDKIRTMKLLYKVYKFQDATKHVLLYLSFLAFSKKIVWKNLFQMEHQLDYYCHKTYPQ